MGERYRSALCVHGIKFVQFAATAAFFISGWALFFAHRFDVEPVSGSMLLSVMYGVSLMSLLPMPTYLFFKRLIDIVFSIISIVVASPLMAIIALAVKLQDGGPVLYTQIRLTKDGKRFTMLKFRSMKPEAEKDGIARLACVKDARITPVGHLIRAVRLDELPQLFNILKGDMTIVGPRPERPEIAAQYEQALPAFRLRLQVKAGLTGLAQVKGQYNAAPEDKLRMDLMYMNNMSLVEDLKLMLATPKVLFTKESTAGVESGQITAIRQKVSA